MKKRTYRRIKKSMNRAIHKYKRLNRPSIVDNIEDGIYWLDICYKANKLGRYYSEWLRCN